MAVDGDPIEEDPTTAPEEAPEDASEEVSEEAPVEAAPPELSALQRLMGKFLRRMIYRKS